LNAYVGQVQDPLSTLLSSRIICGSPSGSSRSAAGGDDDGVIIDELDRCRGALPISLVIDAEIAIGHIGIPNGAATTRGIGGIHGGITPLVGRPDNGTVGGGGDGVVDDAPFGGCKR
jgi:hypothetical protein